MRKEQKKAEFVQQPGLVFRNSFCIPCWGHFFREGNVLISESGDRLCIESERRWADIRHFHSFFSPFSREYKALECARNLEGNKGGKDRGQREKESVLRELRPVQHASEFHSTSES